ncbi:MAG: polyphosphate polymerase domain-containing protein [Bacilli bacterium]|nr:polyphosphate polymerase domain-containing protein [Bacilli bacterium]
MNIVKRREIKYLLETIEYKKQKHNIEQILKKDIHNGNNGYTVRSLYFDTLDDRDFCEKENGEEIRRKIRLRIYDIKDDFAYLEMKQKQGEYQIKRSLKISKEDAIEISKGNYSPLTKYDNPFALELYTYMNINLYRPKVIIEYKRDAYIVKENNIRLTFDHDITSTENSFDIYDPKLQLNPILDKANIVLEIKYNGFLLSYIKDIVKNISCISTSVSKYYLSRNTTHKIIL